MSALPHWKLEASHQMLTYTLADMYARHRKPAPAPLLDMTPVVQSHCRRLLGLPEAARWQGLTAPADGDRVIPRCVSPRTEGGV